MRDRIKPHHCVKVLDLALAHHHDAVPIPPSLSPIIRPCAKNPVTHLAAFGISGLEFTVAAELQRLGCRGSVAAAQLPRLRRRG